MKKVRGRKSKQIQEEHWGKRLASVLKEKNLSNRKIAQILGVAPSVIDSWTRNGPTPSDLKLVKNLADELDVDFCWLLTGSRAKETPFQMNELFKESSFFDGIVRLRVDKLEPRKK